MIVYGEKIKSIVIDKVHTDKSDDNLADITTKPLTGPAFHKHRDAHSGPSAVILFLQLLPDSTRQVILKSRGGTQHTALQFLPLTPRTPSAFAITRIPSTEYRTE